MTTELFRRIHDLVAQIPPGRVATYGQIGLHLGMPRGARTVGWALRRCPPHLPWHRVVNAQGRVSGNAANPRQMVQRERLEGEGVVFDAYGRIDLEAYGWRGM